MLALAIALLFTLTGIIAVLALADSVLKARHAYVRLMREAVLMRSGFVAQIDLQDVRIRRAPARAIPLRRSRALPLQAVPVCAAA